MLRWQQPGALWQLQVLFHSGVFHWNGRAIPFEPFAVFVIPPGSRCEVYRNGQETYVYDYMSFIPVKSEIDNVSVPLCTQLNREVGNYWDILFRKGLSQVQYSRTQANVVTWSLLWAVARPVHQPLTNIFVEQAEQIISQRLHEKVSVKELSEELSISQSQLIRLFLAEHQRTPLQFTLERRAQVAHELLTKTTDPVKSIAARVGYSDIHQFNRFIRQRFSQSPRSLRFNREDVDLWRLKSLKKHRDIL